MGRLAADWRVRISLLHARRVPLCLVRTLDKVRNQRAMTSAAIMSVRDCAGLVEHFGGKQEGCGRSKKTRVYAIQRPPWYLHAASMSFDL